MKTEPLQIFIRHETENRWCNYRGDWLSRRQGAISFSSNVDALHFCRMARVYGILVTFAHTGTEAYRVPVDELLGTRLAADVPTPAADVASNATTAR